MFATVTVFLLFGSALATVVEGNCTVVVNGVQGMPGLEGPPGPPGQKGDPGPQVGGAVYTRWGRTVCGKGATLVYAGRAAGTKYNVKGGTSDTLCMPETPQYLSRDTGALHVSHLQGVEFETFGTSSTPFKNLLNANMPCAVCHTDTKLTVLTVPAQYTCPNGWSLEYNGYLMTEDEHTDRQRKNTLCVDKDTEAVPGSRANANPALIYLMRATCDGLPCPPYNTGMVLPCAVCSK